MNNVINYPFGELAVVTMELVTDASDNVSTTAEITNQGTLLGLDIDEDASIAFDLSAGDFLNAGAEAFVHITLDPSVTGIDLDFGDGITGKDIAAKGNDTLLHFLFDGSKFITAGIVDLA